MAEICIDQSLWIIQYQSGSYAGKIEHGCLSIRRRSQRVARESSNRIRCKLYPFIDQLRRRYVYTRTICVQRVECRNADGRSDAGTSVAVDAKSDRYSVLSAKLHCTLRTGHMEGELPLHLQRRNSMGTVHTAVRQIRTHR